VDPIFKDPRRNGKWVFGILFIGYLIAIWIFAGNLPVYDERRYLMFAEHLVHGYYSPPANINLWNGPGYPLVLVPFVWLQTPLIYPKLLNAFFLTGFILFFYYTLLLYLPERSALFGACLVGVFPPILSEIHLLYTETIALFLIGGFIYCYCQTHQTKKGGPWLILSAFFLAYLALTKIFFGYVLMVYLIVSFILALWKRSRHLKLSLMIFGLAFLFCLPYLIYTYSLTGRILYWSNSGGLSLYCMSTPYEDEWGDWFDQNKFKGNPFLARNHQSFFDRISKLPAVEKDEALKGQAVNNILQHPRKFVINWMANLGRLFFNYPYSYTPQKISTYAYFLPNIFLFVIMIFSLFVSFYAYKSIPYELFSLLVFSLIAFGGSSLLSAYSRQVLPLIPIAALWIFFIWCRVVSLKIKETS